MSKTVVACRAAQTKATSAVQIQRARLGTILTTIKPETRLKLLTILNRSRLQSAVVTVVLDHSTQRACVGINRTNSDGQKLLKVVSQ